MTYAPGDFVSGVLAARLGVGTHMSSSDDGRVAASAVPLTVKHLMSDGLFSVLFKDDDEVALEVLSRADEYDRSNGIIRVAASDPATVEAAAAAYIAASDEWVHIAGRDSGAKTTAEHIAIRVLAAIAADQDALYQAMVNDGVIDPTVGDV